MLNMVENWLNDLAIIANEKRKNARAENKKYVWYSTQKNKDLKFKFCREGESLSTDVKHFKARAELAAQEVLAENGYMILFSENTTLTITL